MRKISVLLLLLGLFWIFSTSVYAADWRWVYSSDTKGYYVDASSAVLRRSDYHLVGWFKVIFEDLNERKKIAREKQKTHNVDGANYNDFYYSVANCEYYINTGTIYMRYLASIDYDSKGNVIYSTGDVSTYSKYDVVVPGSIGEVIYKALSSYAK